MGRLQRAADLATFAQKILLDGVGRDENIRRFGLEMILRGPEKAEAFFGYFQITGTVIRNRNGRFVHNNKLLSCQKSLRADSILKTCRNSESRENCRPENLRNRRLASAATPCKQYPSQAAKKQIKTSAIVKNGSSNLDFTPPVSLTFRQSGE